MAINIPTLITFIIVITSIILLIVLISIIIFVIITNAIVVITTITSIVVDSKAGRLEGFKTQRVGAVVLLKAYCLCIQALKFKVAREK